MSHRSVRVLLLLLLLPFFRASASDPGTALQTATAVKGSTPGLMRAGRGLAEVPRQAAQCFRLPLGLTQMLFSPFPEVTFSEGLRNTGRGVVAPFRFCIAVLEMPYEVVGGLGDAVSGALP